MNFWNWNWQITYLYLFLKKGILLAMWKRSTERNEKIFRRKYVFICENIFLSAIFRETKCQKCRPGTYLIIELWVWNFEIAKNFSSWPKSTSSSADSQLNEEGHLLSIIRIFIWMSVQSSHFWNRNSKLPYRTVLDTLNNLW